MCGLQVGFVVALFCVTYSPFFLQKRVLTVHTLLLFFAKLFRSQKSQTVQRKPSLLPFPMARVRAYEKSLRMFLPKLFPPVMQVGRMVNAAVWWHPKPTCCQVNWLSSALTVTFISLLTCLPCFLPISSFWWNFGMISLTVVLREKSYFASLFPLLIHVDL